MPTSVAGNCPQASLPVWYRPPPPQYCPHLTYFPCVLLLLLLQHPCHREGVSITTAPKACWSPVPLPERSRPSIIPERHGANVCSGKLSTSVSSRVVQTPPPNDDCLLHGYAGQAKTPLKISRDEEGPESAPKRKKYNYANTDKSNDKYVTTTKHSWFNRLNQSIEFIDSNKSIEILLQ